jgi:hypothetical protein
MPTSTALSRLTRAECGRFRPMLWILAADAAEEGKKVILAMLFTGLVFVAVIVLGELTHWLRHRR